MEGPAATAPESAFGVQWHLLHRCNLRCRHCYQETFEDAPPPDGDRLGTVADALLGGLAGRDLHVNLTGGEPLLFDGLLGLVDRLCADARCRSIQIITNGTVTPEAVLRALGGRPRVECFKVSLEGGDAVSNDVIRGVGVFGRARAGLDRIRDLTGKPVVLMATLARWNADGINADGIEALLDFARARRLQGAILERFVPLGRGRDLASEALDEAAWARVADRVAAYVGLEAGDGDLRRYRAFWLRFDGGEVALDAAECNHGPDSMAIMPDGTVYPCRRFPEPIGRLPETPMPEILARLAAMTPAPSDACATCRAMTAAVGAG